jgi:hypothetical protein
LAAVDESLLFEAARDYVELGFEESVLRVFESALLPGLLRIPDCARGDHRGRSAAGRGGGGAADGVVVRAVGGKDPLWVEAIFAEELVNYVVGGPSVMRAWQLYLVEL